MIEKGEQYKKHVMQMREEKKSHETDGCSFMPQVNKKFNEKHVHEGEENASISPSKKVFLALYERRKNNGL